MILIGLAGKKRTGKSTAANYLCDAHNFAHYAFALPLKRMLLAMGLRDYELEQCKERPLERLGITKTPRDLMQTLGTGWGRDMIGDDLWLKLAEQHIREKQPARLVISDVRFESEAAWIRAHGGVIVHIWRDTGANDAHISEQGIEMQPGDAAIENNGPLVELLQQMHDIASAIGATHA